MMSKLKTSVMERIPLLSGIGIFILGLLMVASGGEHAAGDSAKTPTVAQKADLVDVITVTSPEYKYRLEANGRLKPQNILRVMGEVAGKIIYVNPKIKAGNLLEAGNIILKINPIAYEVDVAKAEAGLATALAQHVQARSSFKRAKNLLAQGNVSEAGFEAAEASLKATVANVKQARAQVKLAQEVLGRTVIRTPFPASVISENIVLDHYVSPGQQLAELIDARGGEVAMSLQPSEMRALARTYIAGGKVPIAVTAKPGNGAVGSLEIKGHINRVSPNVDMRSRTATVIAEFDDVFTAENYGRVFADDFLNIEINAVSDKPLWRVPYGAIRKGQYLWIVTDNGSLMKRIVTVMDNGVGEALVTADSPLAGEKVMTTLLSEEFEGKAVRIKSGPALAAASRH